MPGGVKPRREQGYLTTWRRGGLPGGGASGLGASGFSGVWGPGRSWARLAGPTAGATAPARRKKKSLVLDAFHPNRRSPGSFFPNPIVSGEVAAPVVERAIARGVVRDATEVPRWPEADGRVKLAAGWLIEKAGIHRGLRLGNVGVSSAHALALVHHGDGTTKELLALAEHVRSAVREAFGVVLEREPVMMAPPGA